MDQATFQAIRATTRADCDVTSWWRLCHFCVAPQEIQRFTAIISTNRWRSECRPSRGLKIGFSYDHIDLWRKSPACKTLVRNCMYDTVKQIHRSTKAVDDNLSQDEVQTRSKKPGSIPQSIGFQARRLNLSMVQPQRPARL